MKRFNQNNGRRTAIGRMFAWGGALALGAFLMALAQHSAEANLFGWFTLVPLFLAIKVLAPRQAAVAGAFWGLCLSIFEGFGGDAALAFSARSTLFLTVVPAVYAFLGSHQTRKTGFSPLLLGLGWVGVELALQPLALRHGLLACTQEGGLFIRVVGHAAGWMALAVLIAYVNASVLEILTGVYRIIAAIRPAVPSAPAFIRSTTHHFFVRTLRRFGPSHSRAPPALA